MRSFSAGGLPGSCGSVVLATSSRCAPDSPGGRKLVITCNNHKFQVICFRGMMVHGGLGQSLGRMWSWTRNLRAYMRQLSRCLWVRRCHAWTGTGRQTCCNFPLIKLGLPCAHPRWSIKGPEEPRHTTLLGQMAGRSDPYGDHARRAASRATHL